ncbi:MAG TPA: tetratricopeptide repeat protein, partial [bacterium]
MKPGFRTGRRVESTMKRFGRIACVVMGVTLIATSQLFAGGGPNVNGAKLYIQQNELDKALEVLNKEIAERDANNEDAWYLMGYIYARQGKYDKMKEAFDKAVVLKAEFKDKGLKISKDSGTSFHSQFGVEM